jgi:hypothetical protein
VTDPIRNIADLEDAFFGGGQDEKYEALRAFERAGVGADDLLEVVPAVVAIATLLSVLEVVSPEDAANMIGRLPQELVDEAEAWAYYGLTPWTPGNEPSNLNELQAGEDEEVGRIRDFFRRIFSTGPYSGGTPGKSVLNGAGAPTSGTGVNGDFYIDTTAWEIYGPKTLGAWGSGVALTGPAGIEVDAVPPSDTSILWADTSEPGDAVVPVGGSTGQVLAKASGTDYDTGWVTRPTIVNTDGDPGQTIYVGSVDPDGTYTLAAGDVWIEVP